jgi:hypothetical protein
MKVISLSSAEHYMDYELQSSGARWNDRFADCMRKIGFVPCKAKPDIWMGKNGNLYVDDLAIAMKNPKELVDILEKQHKSQIYTISRTDREYRCSMIASQSRR